MSRIGVGLVLGLGITSSAVAQPERRAFQIGMAATAVPTILGTALAVADVDEGGWLIAGGILLGPSIGNWAGGLTGRGFGRFGLRAATLMGGLMAVVAACPPVDYCHEGTAATIALGTVGAVVGLAVWDVATIEGGVQKRRAREITITPVYEPATRATGLNVRLTF